jgi:Lar family restriction alleviation protein
MINKEELIPCPVCGARGEIVGELKEDGRTAMFKVICNECTVHTEFYEIKQDAIDAWNKTYDKRRF